MPPKPTTGELPARQPSGRKRIANRRYEDTEPAMKRIKSTSQAGTEDMPYQAGHEEETPTAENTDQEDEQLEPPTIIELEDNDSVGGDGEATANTEISEDQFRELNLTKIHLVTNSYTH